MKNKYLMITSSLLLIFSVSAYAQADFGFLRDINGKPIELKTSTEYQGNPYLTEDWAIASIVTNQGKSYKGIPIKYDLLDNALYFKDSEGRVNKFSEPIKEFVLTEAGNKIFRQFGSGSKYYYNVLYDGKFKLINRDAKYIKETREYNAANTTKKILSSNKYYLVDPAGTIEEIKLNKKSILSLLKNNQEQMIKYAESQKLNFSSVEDVIKILQYYDTM